MFGIKIVRTDGKMDWQLFRRTLYTALIVWVIGVRLLGLDPFDDIVSGKVSFATLLDGLAVLGLWLLVWHVVWSARPKIS